MDINQAAVAIERFLTGYASGGVQVASAVVRPSGDDVDVIKVGVDVGETELDPAWLAGLEEAIRSAVPEASGYRLQVRAG